MADYKDYSQINSVSREEFEAKRLRLEDDPTSTKSDAADVRAMEEFLELRHGALTGQSFYVDKHVCQCGRLLTFFDLVRSAVVDGHHSKSFVAHTLVGNKYIINPPRKTSCSNCAAPSERSCVYDNDQYGCSWNVNG
jgi:hypothetical protein